ncbi:uncharacterized protein L969DRAFT_608810 [Mixia osmundae IAM 14324]|uniref:Allantoicase domain-containing protein n=1 Tax=Mixia osmundae (strain CBS 9802 / IAM 14324 / JCM 22182 / KY 12970) TaxID=764103 RepID=G7DTB6_MIXOS|nr:uncharacterized protein L969DRAFT_608810 [Mixia osmundae IAM 14324]KEI42899.1 hypothetical protein L969DRAFT_608810 [Mixia osmundae IAM 14324]GAA93763.1 hypothetical protein E5Q_00409 [Mixia osmundae IAM 14324]
MITALPDFVNDSIEVSSNALGSRVLAVSDDFFADAWQLLQPHDPVNLKGQFGPKGALFDGWENARHCPTFNWVIIRLGSPAGASLLGFDIDTRPFDGNEGPAGSVEALFLPELPDEDVPSASDTRWVSVLPRKPLGPASRHFFRLDRLHGPFTHLKLCMYPDGGFGRFRAYGVISPPLLRSITTPIDLAHVLNGGRCVAVSDQHFGVGKNLILPGRGKDMGDGWETKRSRGGDHTDWAILKLGAPCHLLHAEIDTAHFKGNFPESCTLDACVCQETVPSNARWTSVLGRVKLGPHRQHQFQLEPAARQTAWTHVRCTIFPDGGIKRLRLYGLPSREDGREPDFLGAITGTSQVASSLQAVAPVDAHTPSEPLIVALTLTAETFAPYGSVIQSYADHAAAPRGLRIVLANGGTAEKFNNLAPVHYGRPRSGEQAELNSCVYRCQPEMFTKQEPWTVKVLERHQYSSQSFVPISLPANGRYLVIVAQDKGGKPDLTSLRAFLAGGSQGISYAANVWHHPMIALDTVTDFTCLVYETGIASIDCEILEFPDGLATVVMP